MKLLPGNNRIKKTTLLFVLLLIINSALMISSDRSKETLRISEIGFSFLSFFQKGFVYTTSFVVETVNSINELRRVKIEYSKLLERISIYEALEKDYLDLRRENNKLRDLLTFSRTIRTERIPAQIIGHDSGVFFNTITIDKGRRHGVAVNMPVVAFQDGFQGLVGKVVETGHSSSKIIPLYDRRFSVAARLQNLRHEGIVSGTGRRSSLITMNYVSRNAGGRIGYGDIVITSGLSSIYPSGIYIGRVRNVGAREYEPALELELEPVIDFSRLEFVFVLKTGPDS
ncbi:MAG: rod shape-determining protein MreC [Spirochaetes bacterium]|nr:rod shape-determining protein MreC [Spirochaetota bacterium]